VKSKEDLVVLFRLSTCLDLHAVEDKASGAGGVTLQPHLQYLLHQAHAQQTEVIVCKMAPKMPVVDVHTHMYPPVNRLVQ